MKNIQEPVVVGIAASPSLVMIVKYDASKNQFNLISERPSIKTPKVRLYKEDEDERSIVFYEDNMDLGYLLWLCSTGEDPSFDLLAERLKRIQASQTPAPARVTLSFDAPALAEIEDAA